MFILRTIKKSGEVQHFSLGDYYSIVRKDTDPEICKSLFNGKDHPMESFYGYLCSRFADGRMELHDDESYYIMTDTGKTFARIKPPVKSKSEHITSKIEADSKDTMENVYDKKGNHLGAICWETGYMGQIK